MNNEIALNFSIKNNQDYCIKIGSGEIKYLPEFLRAKKYSKIFIISDENVAMLHLESLKKVLSIFELEIITISAGEKSKNFTTFERVCENILQKNVDRKSLIMAFGGGVVGDLSGFIASIILRGIDFVQIPTTLLAAVDSSVGGKTAINSKSGKNLLGAFYQPKLVICDLDFLQTLPEREFKAGYAEILKYGLIYDYDFFNFLDQNLEKIFARDLEIMQKIIHKSCEIKAKIVVEDEREQGLRAILNFGHTFAHSFEKENDYQGNLLHGEAVGIGMLMAAKMSQNLNLIDSEQFSIIEKHIKKSGLDFDLINIKSEWSLDNLVSNLYQDKKTEAKNLTFILLAKIGKAVIAKSVSPNEFIKVVRNFV